MVELFRWGIRAHQSFWQLRAVLLRGYELCVPVWPALIGLPSLLFTLTVSRRRRSAQRTGEIIR